jgi:EAL domain-containing protein (putative c-di-GMP-specific phosphodiesterase class I)
LLLESGDFVPHYQPVVDLRSGAVVEVEALVRRRLPDGSWQWPDVFIPLAERVGLVARVDSAVRAAALADLAELHQHRPYLTLAANVSAVESSSSLVREIGHQIEVSGVKADRVAIEITETTAAGSFAEAQEIFAGLHDRGCRVAIDDLGTGYSALANLGALCVDVLKIDQSFLPGLSMRPKSLALLRGVVEFGGGLDLTMVAEGITRQASSASFCVGWAAG